MPRIYRKSRERRSVPTSENLLQMNMFTGELDDNRTRQQKKLDRQREQPKQTEMFSQRDIAQFGVNPRPLLPISPNTKLGLIFQDPRSEEEIEADRQREAEERTFRMFERPPVDTKTLALVVYEAPCLALLVIEQVSQAALEGEPK